MLLDFPKIGPFINSAVVSWPIIMVNFNQWSGSDVVTLRVVTPLEKYGSWIITKGVLLGRLELFAARYLIHGMFMVRPTYGAV